jgi:hypothetical protein
MPTQVRSFLRMPKEQDRKRRRDPDDSDFVDLGRKRRRTIPRHRGSLASSYRQISKPLLAIGGPDLTDLRGVNVAFASLADNRVLRRSRSLITGGDRPLYGGRLLGWRHIKISPHWPEVLCPPTPLHILPTIIQLCYVRACFASPFSY